MKMEKKKEIHNKNDKHSFPPLTFLEKKRTEIKTCIHVTSCKKERKKKQRGHKSMVLRSPCNKQHNNKTLKSRKTFRTDGISSPASSESLQQFSRQAEENVLLANGAEKEWFGAGAWSRSVRSPVIKCWVARTVT